VGIFVPPEDNPLLEITAANQSLYFSYNGTAYTATLALGKYYEHSELVPVLQTALNAKAGANKFAVTYAAATGYTIDSDANFEIYWLHTTTTLPVAIFGFKYSGTGSASVNLVSEYPPDPAPAYNRFIATADGKFYRVSTDGTTLTEIKMADGTAIPAGSGWSGVWNQKRWYGGNSASPLILRSNIECVKPPDASQVPLSLFMALTSSVNKCYSNTTTAGSTSLLFNTDITIRIHCQNPESDHRIDMVDTIKLYVKKVIMKK
jgi:hypothetical protein